MMEQQHRMADHRRDVTDQQRRLGRAIGLIGLAIVMLGLGCAGWIAAASTMSVVRWVRTTSAVVAFIAPIMERDRIAREQVVAQAAAQAQTQAAQQRAAAAPAQTSTPGTSAAP